MLKPFLAIAGALALSPPCQAQDLDTLRDALSENLRHVHFAKSMAGLILLSDELELSGARYEIDDDVGTELSSIVLPFHRTLDPWGGSFPGLHVEGVIGYANATQRTDDLYDGALTGLETSVKTKWTTYGGLLGIGTVHEVGSGVTLSPILNVGITRIENDANYGGPGSEFTSALADGIAFNWDALALIGGVATRVDWTRPLGEAHELNLVGRYNLRWTGTVDHDDRAQDFSARSQILTVRAELKGPGPVLLDRDTSWRTNIGYRGFLEGDLFGAKNLIELGGGLDLDVAQDLPFGSSASLNGAIFLGDDLKGWTLGLGLSF